MAPTPFDQLAAAVRDKEGLHATTQLPTIDELAAALATGPAWAAAAAAEYAARIARLARLAEGQWDEGEPLSAQVNILDLASPGWEAAMDGATDEPAAAALPALGLHALHLALDKAAAGGRGEAPGPLLARAIPHGLQAVDALYRAARERGKDPPHPTSPLILAWLDWQEKQPEPRPAETRPDRLIPAGLGGVTVEDDGQARTLALFSDTDANGQLHFPTMGELDDAAQLALPVALYDLGAGAEGLKGGQGAPLALRLFVESILAVRVEDRGRPVLLSIPLRDFLARIYPNGRPSPARYWPRLYEAAQALSSNEARIPWYDSGRKTGGLWLAVTVRNIPRGPRALNDDVTIEVYLPPTVRSGPPISPNLPRWGVESAPAYRLALNLPVHWWKPGTTYRPYARGRSWGLSPNPNHYGWLTEAQLIRLAYPASAHQTQRVLLRRAHLALESLLEAGDLGGLKRDGRRILVLPPWAKTTDANRV